MTKIRERAVAFGPNRFLVGVVTTPVPAPPPTQPAVVILNSGVIHRVGANRLSVRVGRALARAGHTVMRFDLSGIGDSDPRQNVLDLDEAVRMDIAAALDHLSSTRDVRSVVLFGLCSGANNAFRYAVDDDRVRGLILIDPIAFPTRGHRLRYYGKRLLRPTIWRDVLTGRNATLRDYVRRARGEAPATTIEDDDALVPTLEEMRLGLQAMIGRGAEFLFVFTGGMEELYNHRGQFGEMFPEAARSPQVLADYLAESDHTFSREEHKQWLTNLLSRWTNDRLAPSAVEQAEAAGAPAG